MISRAFAWPYESPHCTRTTHIPTESHTEVLCYDESPSSYQEDLLIDEGLLNYGTRTTYLYTYQIGRSVAMRECCINTAGPNTDSPHHRSFLQISPSLTQPISIRLTQYKSDTGPVDNKSSHGLVVKRLLTNYQMVACSLLTIPENKSYSQK